MHRATLAELYDVEGPAELVGGKIICRMLGERPGEVAGNVAVSLRDYARRIGRGKAHGGGVGYMVRLAASDREAFYPNASYHTLPPSANPMWFIEGSPDFAGEVRSENDYGPAAELELAAKRADYFEAGTQVVWDVDPVNETVAVYRSNDPSQPTIFHRGEFADAEPSVPGWQLAVDEVFA
jgi:Uma2 family endonuclease